MEPRHHPLPDGRRLVIREAAPDDARAVLAYVETIAGVSDNLTFGPGEFGIELADEVRIIQRFRDDPQQLYLVAEVEGELVGGLTFMAGTRPRIRHAGELGMSVLRSHWRLGIGSRLLDALIAQRRQEAIDYAAYLAKVVELTRQISGPARGSTYPVDINSPLRCAMYDNLRGIENLSDRLVDQRRVAEVPDAAAAAALAVDDAIRAVRKADWRGNRFKEREVLNAVRSVFADAGLAEQLFNIVKAQRDG